MGTAQVQGSLWGARAVPASAIGSILFSPRPDRSAAGSLASRPLRGERSGTVQTLAGDIQRGVSVVPGMVILIVPSLPLS